MLLSTTAWGALSDLFQALIPISIFVVLPIVIIYLIMKNRRHEVDKKTELMMKAVEKGATLDPAFFQQANCCKEKTVKDKLMGWLLAACITAGIGLLACITVLAIFIPIWSDVLNDPGVFLLILVSCAILIAIGIAFFIVYLIGKNKTWAKELAELDAKKEL